MPNESPPAVVVTPRLLVRAWRASDAAALLPILEAHHAHLAPWIPARVATPVPIPQLEERLADFAAAFARAQEFRYALFTADERTLLGDVGLFPRNAERRVPLEQSDRVEMGYWVRADESGRGYVTEAARAMLDVVASIARFDRVEIRCDARNARSAAVPQRLGFTLEATTAERGADGIERQMQRWVLPLSAREG